MRMKLFTCIVIQALLQDHSKQNSLVGKTLLKNCKGRGFEFHPSNMPVIVLT